METYYECSNPNCRWIITSTERNLARFDYSCPRCRITTLYDFTIKEIDDDSTAEEK